MEFGIKLSYSDNEKWKRETTEGYELLRQENTKSLREKENHLYFGILKANTDKQR